MDPTVHLSKRPTRSSIKLDLSLPPFLVAGESIDRIPALSNEEGKHLVQFLKFPQHLSATLPAKPTTVSDRGQNHKDLHRFTPVSPLRNPDGTNPNRGFWALTPFGGDTGSQSLGRGCEGCAGGPDIIDQHPNPDRGPIPSDGVVDGLWSHTERVFHVPGPSCRGKPDLLRTVECSESFADTNIRSFRCRLGQNLGVIDSTPDPPQRMHRDRNDAG